MFFRQSVSGVKVVSQPTELRKGAFVVELGLPDRAARRVGDEEVANSGSKASPFATMGTVPAVFAATRVLSVISHVPGGSALTSRPTPPVNVDAPPSGVVAMVLTRLDIGGTRNTSVTMPSGVMLQTRPAPSFRPPPRGCPSDRTRSRLLPGRRRQNSVAVGGVAAFGVSR